MTEDLRKIDFNTVTVCQLQTILLLTAEKLKEECLNKNSLYNDEAKYQLKRIIDTIDRKTITHMPINDIQKYVENLITIIDFNTGNF